MNEYAVQTPVGPLTVQVTGSGSPAVLWHSLFVDNRSWARMVPALARHRRLILISGPGHGSSGDPSRRYTLQECAEAAVAVLDRLGITEAVDWVGNAWGGHVGILFAARWPRRCRTLVAFGTPTQPLTRIERARTHLLLGLYRTVGPGTLVVGPTTDVLLSAHTRATDSEAVELVHDCLRRADRTRLRNAVVSVSLHRGDLTGVLPQVSAPTLIATGADHSGFTPAQARTAAGLLVSGSVAVIPRTAYLPPLEAASACTELVEQFWACHPVGSLSV
jgi:pimeloyl-ACP methyl ester carboxylesterase